MKRIIVMLFGVFMMIQACETTKPSIVETLPYQQNKSVAAYYEYIDLAESNIVEANYVQSLHFYCKAFEYKDAFLTDYMNAWKLCKKEEIVDSVIVLGLLKETKELSKPTRNMKEYIEWIIETNEAFDTSFMYTFMESTIFDKISANDKNAPKLKEIIKDMYEEEQAVRSNETQNIIMVDSMNLEAILGLYKTHTNINENKIGKNGMEQLFTMLWHISRYENDQWIPVIHNQVMEGHFSNKKYAQLIDSYLKNNMREGVDSTVYLYDYGYALYDQYLIPKISDNKQLAAIDMQRKKIMLSSLENQQKKQLWNFRNGWDIELYQFFAYVSMFPDAPPSFIEKAKKEQEEWKQKIMNDHEGNVLVFDKKEDNYEINLKN